MNNKNCAAEDILRCVCAGLAAVDEKSLPLDDFLDNQLPHPEYRRTVSNILFTFFRRKKAIDTLIGHLCSRPPKPFILRVLQCTITQVYFCTAIAPESAVNVAVELVKNERDRFEANFLNAVLRRILAAKVIFGAKPDDVFPANVLAEWSKRFSAPVLQQMADTFMTPADNTFRCRCNRLLSASEALALEAVPLSPPSTVSGSAIESPWQYYTISNPELLLQHADWSTGRFYFQDPATSGALSLPDFTKVRRAIDICAAPGGKALMLTEMLPGDAELVAADRSPKRQLLTADNFRRASFDRVRLLNGTPSDYPADIGKFDLVLADVPCSNTGVFRRRPDALWRFSGKKLKELLPLQAELLTQAAQLCAASGQLLYSTCSIEPDENERQIAAFIAANPDFELVKECVILPDQRHDGAYSALLRRRNAQSICK